MEHLLFNCHGEATLLLQGLASLPFVGAFAAAWLRTLVPALVPVRVRKHDHNHGE
jgi:hypothetical protein